MTLPVSSVTVPVVGTTPHPDPAPRWVSKRHGHYGYTTTGWVCVCDFTNDVELDTCWGCGKPCPPREEQP